jgi:hypothetical protein
VLGLGFWRLKGTSEDGNPCITHFLKIHQRGWLENKIKKHRKLN